MQELFEDYMGSDLYPGNRIKKIEVLQRMTLVVWNFILGTRVSRVYWLILPIIGLFGNTSKPPG